MKKLSLEFISILIAVALLIASTAALLIPTLTKKDTPSGPSLEDTEQFPDENPDEVPDNDDTETRPPNQTPEEPEDMPEDTPDDVPVEEPLPSTAFYAQATTDGLNIRSGPGTAYSSVGSINSGDMVVLLEKSGSWYRTQYKNKTAYISASYVKPYEMPLSESERIERVIDEGLKLLGFPYVYGAIRYHDGSGKKLSNFDPTKYDCSSLMQYIFYHGTGINLNMTTRTQIKQGTYVAKADIRRGDLIFFTNSSRYHYTGIERVGHVALYLGNNYILHTASDYAVIEEISAQRWKYYIETRRFI